MSRSTSRPGARLVPTASALVSAKSVASRKVSRKKPMEHGTIGTNARKRPFKDMEQAQVWRAEMEPLPSSQTAWEGGGFDDKLLRRRQEGWSEGDPLSSTHWVQKLRKAFVSIREKPYRGVTGYDELGRDATAKFHHKQFVDRCWRSSTSTRSAAAVDLSQAPGTTPT